MKAHLMNTHLLVPKSRSSAKVKVKYQGNVSAKMGVSGALVFHKHILFHKFSEVIFSVSWCRSLYPKDNIRINYGDIMKVTTGVICPLEAREPCYQPFVLCLPKSFNPLPGDKILDRSKLEQIANEVLKCI